MVYIFHFVANSCVKFTRKRMNEIALMKHMKSKLINSNRQAELVMHV